MFSFCLHVLLLYVSIVFVFFIYFFFIIIFIYFFFFFIYFSLSFFSYDLKYLYSFYANYLESVITSCLIPQLKLEIIRHRHT